MVLFVVGFLSMAVVPSSSGHDESRPLHELILLLPAFVAALIGMAMLPWCGLGWIMAGRGGIGAVVLLVHLYFAAAFFGWMFDTKPIQEDEVPSLIDGLRPSLELLVLMAIAVVISIASPVVLAAVTRPKPEPV